MVERIHVIRGGSRSVCEVVKQKTRSQSLFDTREIVR